MAKIVTGARQLDDKKRGIGDRPGHGERNVQLAFTFRLTRSPHGAIVCSMKTYSTEQAATKAGIHAVTLRRWLSQKKVRPSIAVPMKGQTLWRWTAQDVNKLKEYNKTYGGRWPRKSK